MGRRDETYLIQVSGDYFGSSTAGVGHYTKTWMKYLAPQENTTSGDTIAAPEPTATAESEMAKPQSTASALMELRRYTGLTWDQLAKPFRVARRSLHFWASGKPLNATNEERLRRILACIHEIDRGSASENRALLFQEREGEIPFDLLVAGNYEAVVTLVGQGGGRRTLKLSPLSPEARAARAPRPPTELVDARHDTVHREMGKGRAARSVKVRRK